MITEMRPLAAITITERIPSILACNTDFNRGMGLVVRASVVFLTLATLLCGCDRSDDQIKVYRLVKPPGESAPMEKDAIASTNAPVKSTVERVPAPANNGAVPPNWEPQPLSQMRQASFLVHGENGALADISLVSLGAAAGNVLDNVNRWLGQLAESPITADKLPALIQKLHTPSGDVDIIDISGQPENGDPSKDGRIVAAIAPDEGKTSFYKMRGNADLVGIEKPNFLKWISAVRSDTGRDQSMLQADAPTADKPEIKWEVPAGWSPAPASAMRYASFAAPNRARLTSLLSLSRATAETISAMLTAGGNSSVLPRLRRTRQYRSAENERTAFSTVDIAGTNTRMLAAWTRHDGRAWFVKLTGPSGGGGKGEIKFREVRPVREILENDHFMLPPATTPRSGCLTDRRPIQTAI